MKKLFAAILAAATVITLVSCTDNKPVDTGTPTTNPPATAAPATTEEPTVAVTTDPGPRLVEDEIYLNSSDSRAAQGITDTTKGYGAKFTIPEGEWLTSVNVECPSYSDNFGSLTLYLYTWNTDIETTLASAEIFKQTFEDFTDNSILTSEFEENAVGAGVYVFVLKDGIDEKMTDEDGIEHTGGGVGVWMDAYMDEYDQETYAAYEIAPVINGKIPSKFKTIVSGSIVISGWES